MTGHVQELREALATAATPRWRFRISRIAPALWLLARLLYTLFVILTSIYCLLAYIPMTYFQVIRGGVLPWLTSFAHDYTHYYVLATILLVATLWQELSAREISPLVASFTITVASGGLIAVLRSPVAALTHALGSLWLPIVVLLPLVWLAAIDWYGAARHVSWSSAEQREETRIFVAAYATAVVLTLAYAALAARHAPLLVARVFGASLSAHLVIFSSFALLLTLVKALARNFPLPALAEASASYVLLALFLTWSINRIAFAAVSFTGTDAWCYALVLGFSLAAALSGISARLLRGTTRPVTSGLSFCIEPLRTFGGKSKFTLAALALVTPALAVALSAKAATFDWNYLAQQLLAVCLWPIVLAFMFLLVRAARRERGLLLVATSLLVLAAYQLLVATPIRLVADSGSDANDVNSSAGRYATWDPSFGLIREALAPHRSDASFYAFLAANTSIPRSVHIAPVDVKLTAHLADNGAPKPNIFIFVIDSLRRDYSSAYNPAVTFTPSMGAFARESVVFPHAFVNYGGTALSEPSIWAGGMLLHQQYVTPFYPMNSLEKLVEAEHYQSFVTKDTILKTVLKPSFPETELDRSRTDVYYDLCGTLGELEADIDARAPVGRPIFAYTQPQNIHISVIDREARSVPAGEHYPGFDAAYASRLHRIDGCFGSFIQHLKQRRLYQNSIVVLTADHGDSLGEDGRWGHAYTLFPEVIRVPLIVHLPEQLRNSVVADIQGPVFLDDVTPSLYAALGQTPTLGNEIFGRPLFGDSVMQRRPSERESAQLLVSSYGPVYGLLLDGGRSLYVADGVNYTDYFFELSDHGERQRPVSEAMRMLYQSLIHERVLALDRFYRFSG